jgi:esterase/lipase superfamily enzyme
MERRTTSWFSPNLQMEMPLVAYGHAGQTLLMLPTAAADYLEYEVDAIKPFIDAGRVNCLTPRSRPSLCSPSLFSPYAIG